MKKLQNKVAVITGGTRGLGLSIAEAFVDEGAAVVVGSRSADSVAQAVTRLTSQSGRASGLPCNVEDMDQVGALRDHALDTFGRLDVWINNAGLSCPTGPTAHIPPNMIADLIKTNILGVANGSLAAMRHFVPAGSGKLINISGKGEKKAFPLHNSYASSKAWEHNFTRALAKEYKDSGVGVFLFNPGVVDSDMFRHLRFIRGYEQNIKVFQMIMGMLSNPPEVAAAKAVWLASSATDGRTGLRVSLVGPGFMLKRMAGELGRRIIGRKSAPMEVEVALVEPEITSSSTQGKLPKSKRTGTIGRGYIVPLQMKSVPDAIGNKARSLRLLRKMGYPVPDAYVCTWEAFTEYQEEGDRVLERLQNELEEIVNPDRTYAVRSSANIEDSLDYSFAGQFETVLGVRGVDAVLKAVKSVWTNALSENVRSYLERIRMKPGELKMAVILQEMIEPELSGVAFSKNPINGLDEVLVEAVQGRGTSLVQGGVTPFRWINKWGGWIEKAENTQVPLDLIQEVVDKTGAIAKAAGKVVDLEWVYDGREIYWLQLRDITSLGKINVYSSRMAKEMTPGMIQPLVWSVVVPIPSKVWKDMITEGVGKNDIDTGNMTRSFHYRTYHNLSEFGKVFGKLGMPAESLEMMMGVIPPGAGKSPFKPGPRVILLMPRILRFLRRRWTFAGKLEKEYSGLFTRAKSFSLHPGEELDDDAIMHTIVRVADLNSEMTFYTINAILLMQVYNGIVKSRLKKLGVEFQSFDLTEGMEELEHYDPGAQMEALNGSYARLDEKIRSEIRESSYEAFMKIGGIREFQSGVNAFLERFGHMSDATGHFGSVPWRENPEIVLKLIADYKKPEARAGSKVRFRDLALHGLKGRLFKLFYDRARRFRLYREKYSSLFSYTLMLFRVYYLALGERLVRRGLIASREDVYYLYDEEIRSFVGGERSGDDFSSLVSRRKEDMRRCRDAVLPEIIFGNNTPPVIRKIREKLTGTPTSKGYHTAQVKVVHGVAEFGKLEAGDVLVIPYSDVSWTPLFAKAGAVIAESGGMLSHSSIIAREYNIPAVVSVSGALSLCDGWTVTVDGFKGDVLIHEHQAEEADGQISRK